MISKLLQYLGQVTFAVLRKVDYYFTGSSMGIPLERELEDPYPYFAVMRERGGMLRTYTFRGWMVYGFDEVQEVFRDTRFGNDLRKNRFLSRMMRLAAGKNPVPFLDNPSMLNLDPPDHTRLRRLVSHGFTNKLLMSLEPRIEELVQDCLDTYDGSGRFNVMTQLAKPLPAIVIAELLGLPEKDLPGFQKLSDDLLGISAVGNNERMGRGAKANAELTAYFAEIVEQKRQNPGQDLISYLIAAGEDGDRLTLEEMYSTCVLMLVAGHETTTRLIGNGTYTLLRHPDQLELLRADRSLMPNAIEEMLRFEPPVQIMPRFATCDMEFHGHHIKKDQLVIPVIASANRDSSANPDADRFDVRRSEIKHVAFGHGIHLCLGLNLARLEARVAFNGLLDRFPDMTLAEQTIEWTPLPLVRGMENLVIEVA